MATIVANSRFHHYHYHLQAHHLQAAGPADGAGIVLAPISMRSMASSLNGGAIPPIKPQQISVASTKQLGSGAQVAVAAAAAAAAQSQAQQQLVAPSGTVPTPLSKVALLNQGQAQQQAGAANQQQQRASLQQRPSGQHNKQWQAQQSQQPQAQQQGQALMRVRSNCYAGSNESGGDGGRGGSSSMALECTGTGSMSDDGLMDESDCSCSNASLDCFTDQSTSSHHHQHQQLTSNNEQAPPLPSQVPNANLVVQHPRHHQHHLHNLQQQQQQQQHHHHHHHHHHQQQQQQQQQQREPAVPQQADDCAFMIEPSQQQQQRMPSGGEFHVQQQQVALNSGVMHAQRQHRPLLSHASAPLQNSSGGGSGGGGGGGSGSLTPPHHHHLHHQRQHHQHQNSGHHHHQHHQPPPLVRHSTYTASSDTITDATPHGGSYQTERRLASTPPSISANCQSSSDFIHPPQAQPQPAPPPIAATSDGLSPANNQQQAPLVHYTQSAVASKPGVSFRRSATTRDSGPRWHHRSANEAQQPPFDDNLDHQHQHHHHYNHRHQQQNQQMAVGHRSLERHRGGGQATLGGATVVTNSLQRTRNNTNYQHQQQLVNLAGSSPATANNHDGSVTSQAAIQQQRTPQTPSNLSGRSQIGAPNVQMTTAQQQQQPPAIAAGPPTQQAYYTNAATAAATNSPRMPPTVAASGGSGRPVSQHHHHHLLAGAGSFETGGADTFCPLPAITSHRTNSPWMRITSIIMTPIGLVIVLFIVISPLLHYLM